MKITNKQKGDTIIEVVLAMTLLTSILFTAWAMVNRSTQLSLSARQRIDMVNQLKEQAEIIKTIYANDQDNFTDIVIPSTPDLSSLDYDDTDFCLQDATTGKLSIKEDDKSFHMATVNEGSPPVPILKSQDGSKLVNGDEGALVSVQWKRAPNDAAVDFYIRGCWFTGGGIQKIDNSQFVLRLNDVVSGGF